MPNSHAYRPDVFISYSTQGIDKEIGRTLREGLIANKVRVTAWRDRENLVVGSKFIAEIQKAIAGCDFFLLLFSPRSVASEWCRKEWLRALRLNKPVFPLYVENVAPADWPLELEGLQYINFQRGVAEGMPHLLTALGVEDTEAEILDDPLDRDSPRIDALAQLFYTFASNPMVNAANVRNLMRPLGRAVLETPRAKEIVEQISTAQFTDCRAAGDWIKEQWRAPAPALPKHRSR